MKKQLVASCSFVVLFSMVLSLAQARPDLMGSWPLPSPGQGAVYPITVDPLIYSEQKVTAQDGNTNDFFGIAVALSGDTALVGAYGVNSSRGSAYVFIRSGATWTLQAQLNPVPAEMDDMFGYSVALSGDTALVGAIGTNMLKGSAYVFTRSGTSWYPQGQLADPGGAADDVFGIAVALSGDTALVGASGANMDQGAAYVFARSGSNWYRQQKLTASDGAAGDSFGYSVALSGDTALVGANAANSTRGSAYVFTRSEGIWTPQAKLTASDGAVDDRFGSSAALSADTALLGAPGQDISPNVNQGSAYVFTRGGTTWTQQTQLVALDGDSEDVFGRSVALAADTALVGASGDDIGVNSDQGSAYMFTRSQGIWKQAAKLVSSDGAAGDAFGWSAALSGDTALLGASNDDVGEHVDQGSAYFYKFWFPIYLPVLWR